MSGESKKSYSKKATLFIALSLITLGIWGRFIPHAPNFAPIAAIAIFSGAVLPKKAAVIVPMLAIIISDMFIGLHSTIFWTWGSFALIALISSGYLRDKVSFINTTAVTISGSFLFYILTNFGVWLQGSLYPATLQGLGQSYVNALPFFRNTLLGDAFYTGVIFSAYFLAIVVIRSLRTKLDSQRLPL